MSFGFSRRYFGSIPKQPGDIDRNEDAFWWAADRNVAALSDGASESFDSRLWARFLVRLFVLKRGLSMASVNTAIAAFTRRHDPTSMSWSQQAAFARGSFATLLGIDVCRDRGEARIEAIGDSVAILLDGTDLVASFPYTTAVEFQQRPTLLSTLRAQNAFLNGSGTLPEWKITWRLDRLSAPRIVCMTDAIGEWFLRLAAADPAAGEILLALSDQAHLEALVLHERDAGRLRVDDTTLVILE